MLNLALVGRQPIFILFLQLFSTFSIYFYFLYLLFALMFSVFLYNFLGTKEKGAENEEI